MYNAALFATLVFPTNLASSKRWHKPVWIMYEMVGDKGSVVGDVFLAFERRELDRKSSHMRERGSHEGWKVLQGGV